METAADDPPIRRNRGLYVGLLLVVIVCGLASRHPAVPFPQNLRKGAGDALWALSVFLMCGILAHSASIRRNGLGATLFAVAIEFSQRIHTEALDAIRRTVPGHLVLGSDFAWQDIGFYLIGIGLGMAMEAGAKRMAFARRVPK